MLPQPSLPISQPVKSAKFNASGGAPGSQNTTDSDSSDDTSKETQAALVHSKHDLLVWFEVLELGKLLNESWVDLAYMMVVLCCPGKIYTKKKQNSTE